MSGSVAGPAREQVVLLDEAGHAVGVADKAGVHHTDTPLHLAFSCYVFDHDGRILLSRRALSKRTFPGLWTNSACGHPAPGEAFLDGVRRRVHEELGLELDDLRVLLPGFGYRAEMDGVVEHELCPVLWESWADFRSGVLDGTRDVSPWCRLQVEALPEDPLSAPGRPLDELPPAARPS